MNILLIGAQGSGKGTQAAALSQALHALPIASGDLFRKAFEEKTRLGGWPKRSWIEGNSFPMILQ